MSTTITRSEPFAYYGSAKTRAYIVVGEPLRGDDRFGRVLYYSTHNGPLRWVGTERPCSEIDTEHEISFDSDKVLSCWNCMTVVQPEPLHAFGFARTYSDHTGEIGYVVEPYDAEKHGPLGADTFENTKKRAENLLDVLAASEGPGPWVVIPDQNGGLHVRTGTINYDGDGWEECSGPFDDIRDARKTMHERLLVRYVQNQQSATSSPDRVA